MSRLALIFFSLSRRTHLVAEVAESSVDATEQSMRTTIGVQNLARDLSVNLLRAITLFVKYHDVFIALQRQQRALLLLLNKDLFLAPVELDDGVILHVVVGVEQ